MHRRFSLRKCLAYAIVLAAMIAPPAMAQTIPATANLTASDTGACTTANACLIVTLKPNQSAAVIQLTGTWSGTVQFEASTSPGGTFVSLNAYPSNSTAGASSATANGAWQANVSGYSQIRARCSTYSSGTIAVSINGSLGSTAVNGVPGITTYVSAEVQNAASPSTASQIQVSPFFLPFAVTFSHITVYVGTADASDDYSWGIYSGPTGGTGTAICTTTAAVLSATNGVDQAACSQGTVTMGAGVYYFAFTGNATTGTIGYGGSNSIMTLSTPTSSSTSTGGQTPSTIAIPSAGQRTSSYAIPAFALN